MRDTISIGPVPYDEECIQVGDGDNEISMTMECRRFKEMLQKRFPNPPEGTYFKITSNPHDFGTYYEVAVSFDSPDVDDLSEVETGLDFALFVESHCPATWNDPEVFNLDKRQEIRKKS